MAKIVLLSIAVVLHSVVASALVCGPQGRLCVDEVKVRSRRADQNVDFRLYNRANPKGLLITPQNTDGIFRSIDLRRPLKVIIHGWQGHANCAFTKAMTEGMIPKFDFNVIGVDWSGHGSQSYMYPQARGQVPQVAYKLAQFLDNLSSRYRVNLGNIHVLGHSLGAHIGGLAGKYVKNGKIGRITAMDPAGPAFSVQDPQSRLTTDSARFVDVIHTNAGKLGIEQAIGHIDFFPNGGMEQVGCKDLTGTCHHNRSYLLYLESLHNPKSFPSLRCSSWDSFKNRNCGNQSPVLMGEPTPSSARGVYYLATFGQSLFGKGTV